MNPNEQRETEVSRIRGVYAKRRIELSAGRYSLFSCDNSLRYVQLVEEMAKLMRRFECTRLDDKKIVDVGCGTGFWLRELIQFGATPKNLFGVDLLEERVEKARELCPPLTTLMCSDASRLDFEDSSFDLILQFTVFTSILDPGMKRKVATEMARVLRKGGAILWYDYFVSNPQNPDVRGVSRREICELFPDLSVYLRRITLAPPIGRAIAPVAPSIYYLLSRCKPLCTHYLGFLVKA